MEKQISVIIADSSEGFRKMLSELIDAEEDMRVVAAVDNGREASELILRNAPDVLIADLLLREMEGLSLVDQLRNKGKLPYTIFCSGFFNDFVAEKASALGVVRFFPKPCRITALIESIRGCSGRDKSEEMLKQCRFKEELERDIDEILLKIGIMPHLMGYSYLKAALSMTYEDRELLLGVTKVLYPELAKRFDTSPANLERCIRSAIEIAWKEGGRRKRDEYFSDEIWISPDKKPGNTRFMRMVLEIIDRKRK
ncbi:MAG: response regulator [Ruminococcaceae bacterium]|nr:response regulator [Oscillospiraceae bacterium]